ncbi:hypothetical protein BKA81DRAFT_349637 [Phyllosticta paracitricarpa]
MTVQFLTMASPRPAGLSYARQYEPLTAQSKVGELQELTGLKPISEPTPCRPKHMAWKVSKALNSAPIPS